MLLKEWDLLQDLGGQIETVRRAINRRNELVHARVHIGFAGAFDARESVISLLFSNDSDRGVFEINELHLEQTLGQADTALDAAVDIWQGVDDYISRSS